jgi:hypothetical protein
LEQFKFGGTYRSGSIMLLLLMNESKKFLQLGKYTGDYPEWLVDKAKGIEKTVVDEEYIKKILRIIDAEFNPEVFDVYNTNIIRESRLITSTKVLGKRQVSCGALATVVASVFRNLGIPTKIIHGRFIQNNPEMRHAWNEILLDSGEWAAFDLKGKKRRINEYYVKEFEVVDWEEIEDRIDLI